MPGAASDLAGKRIGWLGDWGGAYPMEPGILALCGTALQTLSDLGAHVEQLAPPFEAEQLWDSWTTLRSWLIAGDSAALYQDQDSRQALKPEMICELERGLLLSAMQVHAASVIRSDWFLRAAELFSQFDALILPSAQTWPFPSEWVFPKAINGAAMDSYHRCLEVVVPVSLIGVLALNLPVGFGDNGLPMGVQLFAPRGADRVLLQMGQAYHHATTWPERFPPRRP